MSKHTFLNGLIMVTALCLTGCFNMKPAGERGSGKSLYEAFYIGDEGTQYFIKPLAFESPDESEILLDMTFKHKDEVRDSAIVNMSIILMEVVRDLETVTISNSSTNVVVDQLEFMFSERKKKHYVNRYSCKMPLSRVVKLFEDNTWSVTITHGGSQTSFMGTRSARKKIEKLDYQIFDLF